jgi:homoserine kinase type II
LAKLTILDKRDIDVIADKYQLQIDRCAPIDGGDENSSFLLNSPEDDYVLTVYEKKSLPEVEQAVMMLNHLAEHEYFTNQVIVTTDGRSVIDYQDKSIILKTWIPGDTLRDKIQEDYRAIGKAIAELHQIPCPDFLPRDHPYGLGYMLDALGQGADDQYEAWLADIINYLQDHFPDHLPRSIIHADLFDDNIIYNQGRFQAIIDFGDACCYYKAYDLGSVLSGACMENGKLDFVQAREVLTGYQAICELEADEVAAIQFFCVYAGAAISVWQYVNNNVRRLDEAKKDKYKLAAQRTEHLFRIPRTKFETIFD